MSEEIDRLASQSAFRSLPATPDVRQSRRLYHIGQNMVKSGRIAAGLLAPYVEGQDVLVVTGNREFTAHGTATCAASLTACTRFLMIT